MADAIKRNQMAIRLWAQRNIGVLEVGFGESIGCEE
jgi:hypothetical protein